MYILRADEDVAHEGKITVCLGLKKKKELILRTDANEYYFSIIFVEASLQWQEIKGEKKPNHLSFKDAMARQNSEKAFPKFPIFSSLKSKMVAIELTRSP